MLNVIVVPEIGRHQYRQSHLHFKYVDRLFQHYVHMVSTLQRQTISTFQFILYFILFSFHFVFYCCFLSVVILTLIPTIYSRSLQAFESIPKTDFHSRNVSKNEQHFCVYAFCTYNSCRLLNPTRNRFPFSDTTTQLKTI